jgi:hypothetical protein
MDSDEYILSCSVDRPVSEDMSLNSIEASTEELCVQVLDLCKQFVLTGGRYGRCTTYLLCKFQRRKVRIRGFVPKLDQVLAILNNGLHLRPF